MSRKPSFTRVHPALHAEADLVAELTRPNWVATGVLVVVLALLVARRLRQSGRRPDPQA